MEWFFTFLLYVKQECLTIGRKIRNLSEVFVASGYTFVHKES